MIRALYLDQPLLQKDTNALSMHIDSCRLLCDSLNSEYVMNGCRNIVFQNQFL